MAANTYIKINFAISGSLRNYIKQQPGIVDVYAETDRAIIFETTLTQQQAQTLITQIASQKLVEYLATVPDKYTPDIGAVL